MVTSFDFQAIADTLRCPVGWDVICSDREFAQQLRFMWVYAMSLYQVDREVALMHSDSSAFCEPWSPDMWTIELMHDDDESVRARLINARTWRRRAERHYCAAMKRFEDLQVATSEMYKKHYTGHRLTDAEVARKSSNSPNGLLFPRCNAEWQRALAWAALSREWYGSLCTLADRDDVEKRAVAFDEKFGGNAISILVELDYELGCTRGRETQYALIKFDFSPPHLVHVYPCLRSDYERNYDSRYVPYEELSVPKQT